MSGSPPLMVMMDVPISRAVEAALHFLRAARAFETFRRIHCNTQSRLQRRMGMNVHEHGMLVEMSAFVNHA